MSELTKTVNEQKKEDILTFLKKEKLEYIICDSIVDEIIAKYGKFKYSLRIEKNILFIQTMKYNLCKIIVNVDNVYNIRMTYNTNEGTIKNFDDVKTFVEKLSKYMANLLNFYDHINQNYHVVQLDNLAEIVVINYDESCRCGGEYTKYILDCDENNFFVFEENYKNKKTFNSIEQLENSQILACCKKQNEKCLCGC